MVFFCASISGSAMGLSFLLRQHGKEESWKEQARSLEARCMLGAGSAVLWSWSSELDLLCNGRQSCGFTVSRHHKDQPRSALHRGNHSLSFVLQVCHRGTLQRNRPFTWNLWACSHVSPDLWKNSTGTCTEIPSDRHEGAGTQACEMEEGIV